jgi:hypothetical protein
MEEIIKYISATTLGGILGYFFRIFIENRLALSRAKEDRRLVAHNSAAEAFKSAIIPSINNIDRGQYKFDVIKSDFPVHREAMLRFIQHLKGIARCNFEKDWNEYENWYQDVCCRGTEGKLFPDEGEVEFSKKRAINPSVFLNKLLVHAAPQ